MTGVQTCALPIFRGRFLRISFDPEGSRSAGLNVRLWDFLFYVTFGFAVTSFVLISGVYLVFSYLIVPAVCAALLAETVRKRLLIGWGIALAAGLSGLLISTQWTSLDLPTGPTIVCAFGALLILSGIAAASRRRNGAEAIEPTRRRGAA